MVNQPATFALTQTEAEQIQAIQFARQAGFARKSKSAKLVMVAFSVIAIGTIFAIDWVTFHGNMPGWFFFSLIAAYLLGTLMHHLVVRTTVAETKTRMLKDTPQVWEERSVKIVDDGLNQVTVTANSLFYWAAIQQIERHGEILFVWVTHFNPVVIPNRAFVSEVDLRSFESEVRKLTS